MGETDIASGDRAMRKSVICHGTLCVIMLAISVQLASAVDVQMNGDVSISGTVTGTHVGDGSQLTGISGSNISTGTISGARIDSATLTNIPTVALSNNAVTPGKISFLGNVAIVAPSGGAYNNPATAMINYNTWCHSPSAMNPCLLKIMPGVYNVGTSSVQMQPFIDIEGSGENTAIIEGNIEDGLSGVVTGASSSELRFLTVKNTGGGTYAIAIHNISASPKITNVTAIASGGSTGNYGVYNNNSSPLMNNITASSSGIADINVGVANFSSSPTMSNITITASGGGQTVGVYNSDASSPSLSNVTITASGGFSSNYGVYNFSSSTTMSNVTVIASAGSESCGVYNISFGSDTFEVKINNSAIKAATNTIYNSVGVITRVGNTQLDGGAVLNMGTLTCVGAYDTSYVALGTNCQ